MLNIDVNIEKELENMNDEEKIKKLLNRGLQIKKWVEKAEYTKELQQLCDRFIHTSYKYIAQDIMLDEICMILIKKHLKKHQKFTQTILKYYMKIRLKELNLNEVCEEINISKEEDKNNYGVFEINKKCITIYLEHTIKRYERLFQKNVVNVSKEKQIDFINMEIIKKASHELGHVLIWKKCKKIENDITWFLKDKNINYWFKNGYLQSLLKEEYQKNHDLFIEEMRCDIFSIIDSSYVLKKYFIDVFDEELERNFARMQAQDFIDFYTIQTNEEKKIMSPIQKFDQWIEKLMIEKSFKESEKELLKKINIEKNLSIIECILSGDEIPLELLDILRNKNTICQK